MGGANNVRALLEVYNPWWTDRNWDKKDPLLGAFRKSIFKDKPRLFHHIKKNICRPNIYGIITIRGPRRVGKSTLLKLLIEFLIKKKGVDPRSIYYISLDYEGLKDIKLFNLLHAIARSSPNEKYVFLDEVSMHPDWARALKNLYDAGLIEAGKMKIVASGSHSMDLAEAVSELRGRQGALARYFNVGGNLVQLPLRFVEVVEAIRGEIRDLFSRHKLRTPKSRFEILTQLTQGNIPQIIWEVYDKYKVLLEATFENYLIHGGYPLAAHKYYETGTIPPDLYSNLAELVINDSEKAKLYPGNLKSLLMHLTEPMRLSSIVNFESIDVIGFDEKAKARKMPGLRDYIEYLRTTWTFFFSYREEGESESCIPNPREGVKNYVLDPFLYHALYSYLRNIPNPFSASKELVRDTSFKGLLVESVIASHLLLSQQLFERVSSVDYTKVLMYRRAPHGDKEKETDFVLCIRKGNQNYRFIIESKYRESPSHVVPEQGKIVLTKDKLDVKNGMAYVPVPVFLLLF